MLENRESLERWIGRMILNSIQVKLDDHDLVLNDQIQSEIKKFISSNSSYFAQDFIDDHDIL